MKINKRIPAVFLAVLLMLFNTACLVNPQIDGTNNNTSKATSEDVSTSTTSELPENTTTPEATTTEANLESSFKVAMVGDVLYHSWLINGGYQEDGSYNYDYIYEYLRDEIGASDLAIANMEGTLAGEPYTGYPLFSAPNEVADMLALSGFNLITTVNNHYFDRGIAGQVATLDVLQEAGLNTVGTRRSADEPEYYSVDINGVKVGVSAFTYETDMQGENIGINGIPIPKEYENLADSFSLEQPYINDDLIVVQERALQMREDGMEVVIFVMHWGTEYLLYEDWFQGQYAQALANAGVDLILGAGPHVVQPIKTISSSDGESETLVYYSVGNAVSNQHYDTGRSVGHPLDGIVALVEFERDAEGEISISQAGYLPTLKQEYMTSDSASKTQVIPVNRAVVNPAGFNVSADAVSASQARTRAIMAGNSTGELEVKELDTLSFD